MIKIEDFLIGIGLFSMLVVVMLAATVDISDQYKDLGINVPIDDNASGVFNKAAAINDQAQDMQTLLTTTPQTGLGAVSAFLSASWAALLSTLNGMGLVTSLITEISILLSIPAQITAFLISAVVITLVLTIAVMVLSGSSS